MFKLNRIEKKSLLQYISERMDKTDDRKVKAEIIHLKAIALSGKLDIRIWED